MVESDENVSMTREDFTGLLQSAVQSAVSAAMAAGQTGRGVSFGDDAPEIEGAAANVETAAANDGGGDCIPYFIPGGGGGASVAPGCFALDDDLNFINRYYRVEQYLFEVSAECAITKAGLYYLNIAADSPGGASVEVISSISDFNVLLSATPVSLIPLYLATADGDDGYTVIDFRNIPTAATWSVIGVDD